MGILVPNFRRPVTANFAGKQRTSLETVAGIQGGTLVSIKDGHENGSRLDGSEYVIANVQVEPGRVIHVAGYGADQVKQIRQIKVGGEFSATLRPSSRNWYKLVEFEPIVEAAKPQVGPQLVG